MRPAIRFAAVPPVVKWFPVGMFLPLLLLSCSDPPSSPEISTSLNGLEPMAVGDPAPGHGLTVEVDPATVDLLPGESAQLSLLVTNPAGKSIPGNGFSWASSDESVVTVTAEGMATATAPGFALVTASRGAYAAQAEITVSVPGEPVSLSWMNCMNGVQATLVSLSSEDLGTAFVNVAASLGISPANLSFYVIGTTPFGTELALSKTLEELGLTSGTMLFVWMR